MDDIGCEICERETKATKHHLVPKNKKDSDTTSLCSPCHRQIHTNFTNYELKNEYNTVERIKNSNRMKSFIRWIRRTNKNNIKVKESNKVRRWRR